MDISDFYCFFVNFSDNILILLTILPTIEILVLTKFTGQKVNIYLNRYLYRAAKSRWGHELHELNNDEIVVNNNPYNVPVDTNILNEDILLDLEIEEELPNKTFTLEGKRIINIGYFFEQLQNIQHLPSFACSLANCQIINEVRNGLASKFIVKCNMCNEKFSLNSQQADELDVNLAAVLGKYITQSYVKLAIVTCYTIAVSP